MFKRKDILDTLQKEIQINNHIIGVAVGSGLSAKYAEKGGSDIILTLSSGKFRQMGLSSLAGFLPFVNSNELVMEFASREVIPRIEHTPVIFGINATDPTIDLEKYIDLIRTKGFSGINNFPTIGMFNGKFRKALESEDINFDKEVEAIRIANRRGLFTIAFVFDKEQAKKMLSAGADVICAHLGLTVGGEVGAKKMLSLESARKVSTEIFDVCDTIRPEVIKMIYGGPVKTPIDIDYMYKNTETVGYIGGSAFERIPFEASIKNTTESFKLAGIYKEDELLIKMLDGVKKHYNYVDFVKEYVANHYMQKIYFSDLASVCHVSRTYLSFLFKKEVGCTFPQYLTQFRLNKAKKILENEDIQLNGVSNIIGYSDYSNFSKAFKKMTGLSPKKYRDLFKKI
ncbi:phosphoenolpyruvate hydrolase family protein [Clostridium sp. D2Q-14]|uniref:phosphoenolpyruvate hydrolase family protein n=1 Tax=Anaeromonas gelatinilytica TaxID=2683194 RepID=UPI00193C7751|nr:phosphoenolpyruvate hydrolase family protein [Anaeromonas gelatinilytica]MBS4535504.1 phosphoenolpyruvate hydrolase family protein [Anaeromonas gelatinilytica]